jgi:hypothetical protein
MHLPRHLDVAGPSVLASASTLLSSLIHVNWIGVGGLAVSAGWLGLGYLKWRYPAGPPPKAPARGR